MVGTVPKTTAKDRNSQVILGRGHWAVCIFSLFKHVGVGSGYMQDIRALVLAHWVTWG